MHNKKIVGAITIFLCLFFGAWYLDTNHKTNRVASTPELTDTIQLNASSLGSQQPLDMFKSREYIRILRLIDE